MNNEQIQTATPLTVHDYKSNIERACITLSKFKEIEYNLVIENKLQTHTVNDLTIQSLHSEKDSPMCKYIKDPTIYGYS